MLSDITKPFKPKLDQVIANFIADLRSIHTGRASSALVEDLKINQYNSILPLKQLATIATPSATLIVITPWDKGSLQAIESAIKESDLNINPSNDGSSIRLPLPPMSAERREEFVKIVRRKAEEARIVARGLREDAWKQVQNQEKQGLLTEDDRYRGEDELNKTITEANKKIEEISTVKEKEILTL